MTSLKPSVITQLRRLYPEGYWEWNKDYKLWVQYSSDPKRATGPVAVLREVTAYSQLYGPPGGGEDRSMNVYQDETGERVPILDGRSYSL